MFHFEEFKSFYNANILLCVVILFSVVYCIYNWDLVLNFSLYNSNSLVIKPILVSGILFLIFHMLITWDDNVNNVNNDVINDVINDVGKPVPTMKTVSNNKGVGVGVGDDIGDSARIGNDNTNEFGIGKPFGSKYRFSLGGSAHKSKIIGSGLDHMTNNYVPNPTPNPSSKRNYHLTGHSKPSQTSSIFIPQSKSNNYGINF